MTYKINRTCLKFSSVAIFMLFIQFSFAQANNRNIKELGLDRFAELDSKLVQNAKALGNNVVAMVWTDTLVYKRELGEFDSRTVVPVGDLSKWLTTALVLQLVDEGKISLDDKITQYLPEFSKYGKNYITIRHCINNYTGLETAPVGLKDVTSRKKYASLEEAVNDLPKREIQSNPGTEFRFSNYGFEIAGRIVEIVSKKKFEMLIKQKLFNPLSMRQTNFNTLDGSSPSPSVGAVSSANDYMQFLKMLLNGGTLNGNRVLSENAVKELRTIQTKEEQIKYAPKAAEGMPYALGSWVVEVKDNEASSLTSAGLFGSIATVDWCRSYVHLLLVKTLQSEQKKDSYLQMKEAIDDRLRSKCK